MGLLEVVISFVSVIVAIALPLIIEKLKSPNLEIYPQREDLKKEDDHWWYHLIVKNKKRETKIGSLVQRNVATQCQAFIEFIDKESGRPLHQIIGKWGTQPNPISFQIMMRGTELNVGRIVDETKIPTAQTTDIGFRERSLDIVIKYRGEKACYALDPWAFDNWRADPKCKMETDEYILEVKVMADNMAKPTVRRFILKNKGTELEDVKIISEEKYTSN